MIAGGEIVMQLSQADWRALLKREVAWQTLWEAAKRCEVLP